MPAYLRSAGGGTNSRSSKMNNFWLEAVTSAAVQAAAAADAAEVVGAEAANLCRLLRMDVVRVAE